MSSLTAARMSYAAALVGSVTYGMYVIIAGMSIRFLLRRNGRLTRWQHQITLWYTLAMLIVSTIYYVSAAKWSEVEFVEATINPQLFATFLSNPLAICKDTAFVVNTWLADSLIIYRLYALWQNNIYVVILPLIIYFASVGCGIGLLIQTAQPNGSLQQSSVINLGIPTWSLSVGLNVMCTLLICYRLWNYHRRLQSINHKSSDYASVAVIFIESAAAYSITGLIYIPLFAKAVPLSYPITALWGSVTSIAPQIIILRIALGIDILTTSRTATTGASLPSFNGQGSTTRFGERSLQGVATVKNSSDVWDGKPQRQVISMKPMNSNDA